MHIRTKLTQNKCFVLFNSSGVAFTKDSGQLSENFSRKFDKLKALVEIRIGGHMVMAGKGIDPIVEILSS